MLSTIILQAQSGQNSERINYRIVAVSNADNDLLAYSNEVSVAFPMQVYLPNAFTPNGDGLNDAFGVVGEGIVEMQLVIYNRWGELVFESKSVNEKWDGYFNGSKAPVGVYGYELLVKNGDNQSMVKKGTVTLVN